MTIEVPETLVTVESLGEALGGDEGGDELDPERVERALDTAVGLLQPKLDQAYRSIPQAVVDQLVLEVAQEAYTRLDAPAGGTQFAQYDGSQAVRGPRDPLNRVYPTLSQFVVIL